MPFKILSLDGGGTRGVISATILDCIYNDTKKHPAQIFDLLAGTSTGGIIAVSLMAGLSTNTIVDLYLNKADDIFYDSFIDKIPFISKFETLARADYSNDKLKEILIDFFGKKTLGDLHQAHTKEGKTDLKLMVPSFDLSPKEGKFPVNFRAHVFNSFFIKDKNVKLVDLCLMTSAGPTYFPIYKDHIDGGVALNNPAMAAIAFAINKNTDGKGEYCYEEGANNGNKKGLGLQLDDLSVFSLGTGTSNKNYVPPQTESESNWGGAKWIGFLPDLLTESNLSVSDYYARQVLGIDQYKRIHPKFDGSDPDCPPPPKILKNRNNAVGLDEKDPEILGAMHEYAKAIYSQRKVEILNYLGLSVQPPVA